MSDALRSNGGCWTCRVRRKKCDEVNPTCLTCASLHLPCYGYGPKPAWMDRGPKEREVAKRLRDTVKNTLSLQRSRLSHQPDAARGVPSHEPVPQFNFNGVYAHDVSSAEADILLPEGSSSTDHSSTPALFDTSSNAATTGSYDSHTSHESSEASNPAVKVNAGATHSESVPPILSNASWSILPDNFEEDQAILLMHFFDHVLPLQFRFYNHSVLEGGRGWLLSILTQTKPLYLVALNLAAYHQQSILVRGSRILCTASLQKLQERHIECIKVLRCHLEKFSTATNTRSSEDCIECMACITLLIALELFRGDTHDWQMHLQAASALSIKFGRGNVKAGPSSRTHKVAMEFFTGVTAWYDILSCASTGLKPFTNPEWFDEDVFPHIRFDKLMGCENWVVRLIWEIATFAEWKTRLEAGGSVSMWEIVRRGSDIKRQLETGLLTSSGDASGITSMEVMTANSEDSSQFLVREITRIFANAALVYLEVVIFGPHPNLPEIRQGVSKTMAALDKLREKDLVRNLLWPVCIAGCMATVEYESYWRNLLSGVSQDQWSFGRPRNVLKIIEECWLLRKCEPGAVVAVDWMTAMRNLDMRVLLV